LIDKDKEAKNPDEKVIWQPKNYLNNYNGPVLLRKALEHSLNIIAIKVTEKIGAPTVASYAKQLGIESPLMPTLSLALGASDVTLKEMTSAMGCLANYGIKTTPYFIVKILDSKGRVVEENFPEEKDAISTQTAFLMTNLLRGVIEHGTGVYARQLRRPAAGKTGTTNDCADAWFIGYTPQLVCGVWVGYDDHSTLGNKMTGGRVACPIWTDFMAEALRGQPKLDFNPPDNITFVKIDSRNGLLALGKSPKIYLEAFKNGTEPKTFSSGKQASVTDIKDETEIEKSTETAVQEIPASSLESDGGF